MKNLFLITLILSIGSSVMAGERTIITTQDGRVISVEKVQVPTPEAFMTFEEADANKDACIDRQEARDAGILNFRRFDRNGDGCLNKEEYEEAGSTPDLPASR